MSEAQYNGPLDIVRQLTLEGETLDREAQERIGEHNAEMVPDFAQVVQGLEQGHPLMHQEVIVYGQPISIAMEGELVSPMVLAPNAEYTPAAGRYSGFTVREVYDTEADSFSFRVLHMVHTRSTDSVSDDFGHMYQAHQFDYVCAIGSEVVAVNPINAHSLQDLEDDPIIAEVDKMIFGDDQELSDKVQKLSNFMNGVLHRLEDQSELNQQRVSYLNSLDLLADVVFLSSDFLIGDRGIYENSPTINFSNMEHTFEVYPETFQLAHGYERVSPIQVLPGGPPELFVESHLYDGQRIFVPLKSIQAAY